MKNLIDEIINLQFFHIADSEHRVETQEEYKELWVKAEEIYKIIDKNISENLRVNLRELSNFVFDLSIIANKYYFKKGVESAYVELDFIKNAILGEF